MGASYAIGLDERSRNRNEWLAADSLQRQNWYIENSEAQA